MTQEQKDILDIVVDDLLSDIENEQEGYLELYKVYLQFIEDVDSDIHYWVHEYRTSKDEIGFIVYFKTILDGKKYSRKEAYGIEGESRTSDWVGIINEEI